MLNKQTDSFSKSLKRSLQRGVQLIEMAVVLPVLLLIVFGIIEYSIVLGAQLILNSAASEAARRTMAFVPNTDAAGYEAIAASEIQTALPDFIGDFKNQVTPEIESFDCNGGTCIRIRLSYLGYSTNPLIANFPLIPLPDDLSAEAIARVEVDTL